MSEQQKSCPNQQPVTPNEVKDTMSSILEKMGAGETCKQAAETYWAQYAASLSAKMDSPIVDGEFDAQTSGGAGANSMEQSGCGTFIATALRVANNSKILNCILQNAASKTEMTNIINQTITFQTLPLTKEEVDSREKLVNSFKETNPLPQMSDVIKYVESVEKLNERRIIWNDKHPDHKLPLLDSTNTVEILKVAQDGWHNAIKAIENAFNRDMTIEGSQIEQKLNGYFKVIASISANDQMKIESILKDITKDVAETDLSQKTGANALAPNLKEVSNTDIEKNQEITGAQIANKIYEISNHFNLNQSINFISASKINFKNLKITQDIVIDLCTEALITSAIDAGVKTSADILSDTEKKTKIETESKGIDDIIKAQGEANAAAIKANKVSDNASYSGIAFIILIIVLIGVEIYIKKYNIKPGLVLNCIRYSLVGMTLGSFILLIVFCVLGFTLIISKIGQFFGAKPSDSELESNFNRSMELYNIYWSAYKCDKKLTVQDIVLLGWDNLNDDNLKIAMDKQATKRNEGDIISLSRCYDVQSSTTTPEASSS